METTRQAESTQPRRGAVRDTILIIAELAPASALFILPNFHLLPRPDTLWLLILGWISLRVRKSGWKSVGLTRPASWSRTFAVRG